MGKHKRRGGEVGGKLTTTTSLSRVKNKTWAIKIKMHTKDINSTGAIAASLGRNLWRL